MLLKIDVASFWKLPPVGRLMHGMSSFLATRGKILVANATDVTGLRASSACYMGCFQLCCLKLIDHTVLRADAASA